MTSLLLQMPEQPACAFRLFQQSWSISFVKMLSGRLCGAAVVVSVQAWAGDRMSYAWLLWQQLTGIQALAVSAHLLLQISP